MDVCRQRTLWVSERAKREPTHRGMVIDNISLMGQNNGIDTNDDHRNRNYLERAVGDPLPRYALVGAKLFDERGNSCGWDSENEEIYNILIRLRFLNRPTL